MALRVVLARLKYPSLTVSARSHLSLAYEGLLEHKTERGGDHVAITELVDRNLETEAGRDFLRKALELGALWMSAPIYIGVALSLRNRLRNHKNLMIDLQHQGSQTLPHEESPISDYAFAREVVNRGIPLRDLLVSALPLATSTSDADPRTNSESAESILNRIFFPMLGRR